MFAPTCLALPLHQEVFRVDTDYSTALMTLTGFELLIATIGTIATTTWIGLGILMQRFYLKHYRVINIILALTLLECIYSILK